MEGLPRSGHFRTCAAAGEAETDRRIDAGFDWLAYALGEDFHLCSTRLYMFVVVLVLFICWGGGGCKEHIHLLPYLLL